MIFNEDARVTIPCILHLIRLSYQCLTLKDVFWDEETNLFPPMLMNGQVTMV